MCNVYVKAKSKHFAMIIVNEYNISMFICTKFEFKPLDIGTLYCTPKMFIKSALHLHPKKVLIGN